MPPQPIYRCADCELDAANRRFVRQGTELALEPKVFGVLAQLLDRSGDLVSREELLDAVWGHRYVTPSTLNRVIGLARRALADDSEAPRFIQTVHGAGYRYVGPMKRCDPAAGVRVRFEPTISARLPARLQSLIGREGELRRMNSLMEEGRSLTLVGTGGMGKTQCALAFAHTYASLYPDGVWFFDLAAMQQPDEVVQALAVALAIAPSSLQGSLGNISTSFAGRQALLFLDNCDRLSERLGPIVFELLRSTEQLRVLATSQQPLNFIGERVLRMPPLGLPPEPSHPRTRLEDIAAAPAVVLLVRRIQESLPQFTLSEDNCAVLAEICRRLDGMPLALELAAVRFALLSPTQVLERLDQRFRFLAGRVAGRDTRHQNLLALLRWSFGLLSADEQRLLTWLSVYVQGFTADAAINAASAFTATPEMMVDLLTGLANKSLVSIDHGVSPPRYRLLESVREFAREQLRARGEERQAQEAHLTEVLRMTEMAHSDMLAGRMRERIATLSQEHGNIDEAVSYAIGSPGHAAAALRIVGQLAMYFKAHGAYEVGKRVCDRALGASSERTAERARALLSRGVLGTYGDKEAADLFLQEAMQLAEEVGDEWTYAYASAHLALWLVHANRCSEAQGPAQTVMRIAERREDALLGSVAGLARGWLQLQAGDLEGALTTLQAHRKTGSDYHQHHFISMYVGLTLFRLKDYAEAAAEWHEALVNAIAVGHRRGMAGSMEGCAYIAVRDGNPEQACRFLSAAEQIRQRTGSPLFSFWIGHNQEAHATLRERLGSKVYQSSLASGAGMREEVVINEAALQLQRFAARMTGD